MHQEPKITVNGIELSVGESMTMRVALTHFHNELSYDEDYLGSDEHGRAMRNGYFQNATKTLEVMHNGFRKFLN